MRRRSFLAGTTSLLATPALAQPAATLKYVPAADIGSLDPLWTPASQTRDHAFLIYDTLYGLDDNLTPQPQMLAGHVIENDGKLWRMTLRDGLRFHDNTPVLATSEPAP